MSKEKGNFFNLFDFFNKILILFHSILVLISFAPGLVDSAPMSTIFAPELNKLIACLYADFFLLNFPPSEKLSGVRFNTPKIFGIFLKLKLEKFIFFDLIFLISEFIFFFKFFGRYLI